MSKKVIFIGGVFAEENIQEIKKYAIGTIEYSANIFQERLIKGFRKLGIDFSVISAPFIGAFPIRSRWLYFRGFHKQNSEYHFVPFLNIWGIRNFARAHSIKRKLKEYIENKENDQKIIIIYSAHEPFLEAAAWAKQKNPQIKVCFVVPDLPQYMNLDSNRSWIYDVLKKLDIARINKYMACVDSFVVLTEQMKAALNVNGRPAMVVEGII